MEDAKDTLKKLTAWDTAPALSEAELDALLEKASLMDSDDVKPSDAGWTPTYDINAAAAAGWMIKAGRASGLVEVDPPGSGIYTSKVFENCRAMARLYASKRSGTIKAAAPDN
jgi:hypothetical protein